MDHQGRVPAETLTTEVLPKTQDHPRGDDSGYDVEQPAMAVVAAQSQSPAGASKTNPGPPRIHATVDVDASSAVRSLCRRPPMGAARFQVTTHRDGSVFWSE